jgi:hypothetical protein
VLQVTNTSTSGLGPAIVGTTDSTAAAGIKGIVTATTGTEAGLFGTTSSAKGYGVNGQSPFVGVYGSSSGPSSEGASFGINAGVWGDTGAAPGFPYFAGVLGTADGNYGGAFYNNSDIFPTLAAENFYSDPLAPVFTAFGTNSLPVCDINRNGDLTCTGTKSAVVPVDGGSRRVALYAVEAPENWFEDFGSGTLANGAATIALDPTFVQTVNTGMEYHVFLTPNGDCKGLYASQKSAASFDVHELGGGTSNVAFDYRVVVKRSGYENVRLADLTERYKNMEMRRELMRQRGTGQAPDAPSDVTMTTRPAALVGEPATAPLK